MHNTRLLTDTGNQITERRDFPGEGRKKLFAQTAPNKSLLNMYTVVNETCGTFEIKHTRIAVSDLSRPKVVHSDKYLVVGFNFIHYESVPFIEALYRPSFPNILYCPNVPFNKSRTVKYELFEMRFDTGPDSDGAHTEDGKVRNLTITLDFHTQSRARVVFNVHYILYDFSRIGFSPMETPYWCIEAAMHHAPHMRGYIYMADDAMFHHWNIKHLNPDKFWWYENVPHMLYDFNQHRGLKCKAAKAGHVHRCKTRNWWWYGKDIKEMNMTKMLMKRHSNLSLTSWNNLQGYFGGRTALPQGYADFYYVPQAYGRQFLHLAEILRVARLWHEMAVATIIFSLTKPSDIEVADFYYNWNYKTDRKRPSSWYKKTMKAVSVHPLKLGLISKSDKQHTRLFCDFLFPVAYKNTYESK